MKPAPGYTIFVAEVASTFNERLLLDYMLKNVEDPKEKIALLDQEIENITGTFYFQSLLADYEYQAHLLSEKGMPVTAEILSGIISKLFEEYYGENVEKEELMNVLGQGYLIFSTRLSMCTSMLHVLLLQRYFMRG